MSGVIEPIDRELAKAHEAMAMECRSTRHWMERQASAPADWYPPPLFSIAKYVIHYQCYRCGTLRHIAIDHQGGMLASTYDWPDWYRRRGEPRLTGEELRLWQVKQARSDRQFQAG